MEAVQGVVGLHPVGARALGVGGIGGVGGEGEGKVTQLEGVGAPGVRGEA